MDDEAQTISLEGLLGNARGKDCAVARENVRGMNGVGGILEGNGAPVADFGAEVE